MQYETPSCQRFVGGEDHGAVMEIAVVDDLEHEVGGIAADGEVANFVDHEDGWMGVAREGSGELTAAGGDGESFDKGGGAGEQGLVAVLDGAVGDGDREVGLTGPGGSVEDEVAALAHQFGAEVTAEQLQAHRGLEGEVELVDGTQEREAGLADRAFDPGLGAMSDFLGDEEGQEVAIAEALGFAAALEFRIEPPHGGKVQASEHAVEIERGHHRTPWGRRSRTCWAP